MKKVFKIIVLTVLILSCGGSFATVVTFDDLPPAGPQGALIPDGYAGFTWSNFGYADPLQTPYNPSGYVNGTVSPPNIAFNAYGNPSMLSNGSFEFVGAYFTGAWCDGLEVTVDGYLNGELVDSKTIITSYYTPSWSSFNWIVDKLNFSSSGGVPVKDGGTQFVMDNFTYVPEPCTMVMLAIGGLAAIRRRRK